MSPVEGLFEYKVYTALDGITGIAKVKEIAPHIVLLDMKMPRTSGIEMLQEIKKINPKVGVIMVTVMTDHDLAMKSLELGAYDYITKPVNLDYLETVVMVKIVDILG